MFDFEIAARQAGLDAEKDFNTLLAHLGPIVRMRAERAYLAGYRDALTQRVKSNEDNHNGRG